MTNRNPDGPVELDELDRRLIRILQEDCRTPLEVLAKRLGTSRSTIHYRIRRLKHDRVIEGYYAKVSPSRLRKEYAAIVLTRARPGIGLVERVKTGRQIALIPGVWGVYVVFGEYDYIFLVRADNREQLAQKVNLVTKLKNIERTNSQIVEILIKEDPRIDLEENLRKKSKMGSAR